MAGERPREFTLYPAGAEGCPGCGGTENAEVVSDCYLAGSETCEHVGYPFDPAAGGPICLVVPHRRRRCLDCGYNWWEERGLTGRAGPW